MLWASRRLNTRLSGQTAHIALPDRLPVPWAASRWPFALVIASLFCDVDDLRPHNPCSRACEHDCAERPRKQMRTRRAGAPRLIDWTGERCVPWAPDVPVIYEHFHRYLWAARLVRGRRVLDLGSGEGFGAAILADVAAHVVGVDVDERTIEHSRLNYAGGNLEFVLGSAVDLGAYEDGSFDVVVAFEVIEHLREQEQMLAEIARVLGDDGLLIASTPDRLMYEEARTRANPYHERELSLEEFGELLGREFAHVATWGQRTITGSHLHALDETPDELNTPGGEFFLARMGDEWQLARPPAALYCIALASKVGLPDVGGSSTLADCDLELMRVKEQESVLLSQQFGELRAQLDRERQELVEALESERASHARLLSERDSEREQRAQNELVAKTDAGRNQDALTRTENRIVELQHLLAVSEQRAQNDLVAQADAARNQDALTRTENRILELQHLLAVSEQQLADVRQAGLRAEQSVTWQIFQRVRGRLYLAIGGERSLRARALGSVLRFLGRRMKMRSAPVAQQAPGAAAAAGRDSAIQLPEFGQPTVSLVIPVHTHAALTHACLVSIRDRTDGVAYEVILVDDTADAPTKDLLKNVRGARILHNETNLGFLRSMNRGASVARGDWIVLFNNDTEVTRRWLSAMLQCATSAPDVGVVTPKFIYPDGRLNEAGAIVWRDGDAWNYGRGDVPDRYQYEYRRETDYGSAAALMVRSDFWNEVGGFDQRYVPIYYEDTDLCFAARNRGLRVMYEPEAVVVHLEGATSGTDPNSGAKRHQEQNRQKFVQKWRSQLEEQRHFALENVRIAADRYRGAHVLVVDHRIPMPDRDSGSLRMIGIMRALIGLGARVTFIPENLAPVQPYTHALQRMGIEVLYGPIEVKDELRAMGAGLDLAILSRPHPASHWLDTVREHAPSAIIAYDTVDLHWLREARRGASQADTDTRIAHNRSLDPELIVPKAKALRELELAMIRASDATLVVTDGERSQVERDVPRARVLVVPNIHDVVTNVAPPDSRSGILFVGGFEHVPNVDAAVRLVKEVMPEVWRELGDVQVRIVGPSAPPEVQALASPLVDVTGWVEDVAPLLQSSRLLLAPLRYGAGMKGKVTQCLAAGLPVVTTPIGAEGLASEDAGDPEQILLIGASTRELIDETIRLYRDDELWRRLSRAGQASIAKHCSTQVVSERISELLDVARPVVGNDEAQPPGPPEARLSAGEGVHIARVLRSADP
jgi:GT2 family glycosyltransferase/SAM-dependent methyltransferase/glycosyltransferase involved in cell wall biosynthesis